MNRKVEELLIRAQNGDCEAQYQLGDCYFNGDGIAKNDAEAFRWYESSAWGGSMWGKYNYGKCFRLGIGVEQDWERARREFRLSADMGNPWALQQLAEMGDVEAQYQLGDCYYNGDKQSFGMPQDDREAFRWYESSAWGGSMWGKYNYGKCFLTGRGVAQDAGRARHEFRLSADMGNPWALLRLAEMGDAVAMYQLGDCYYNGDKKELGLQQNDEEAFKWYKKSADKGNSWGCFNVAKCYLEGKGVSRNREQAIQYLQMSANVGNEFAAYLLTLQGESALSAIRGESPDQQWAEIRKLEIPCVGSVGEILDLCVEEVKKPETLISVAKDVTLWLLMS